MNDTDSVVRANTLLASGQRGAAISTIEAAAAAGNVDALFTLAVWLLAGDPVARDLPRARSVLRRCAEIGHADAALMEVALTATGSGGPPSWEDAYALLKRAANNPRATEQLDLLATMELDTKGHPIRAPQGERLSNSPDVVRFAALLSPAECRYVAMTAQDLLEPAVVVDPRSGKMVSHPIRTSFGAVIGPVRENLVIRAINARIAAISGTSIGQGEPLAVLRYSPGQQYRAHLDSMDGAPNQRIRTVLVYLNQGFKGGETYFTANGLKVSARGGDAIMFSNIVANGTPDRRSEHAGLPVIEGVKWLATRWIRERPYDPWNPG
jgi:prolyl 4-hydroxylase